MRDIFVIIAIVLAAAFAVQIINYFKFKNDAVGLCTGGILFVVCAIGTILSIRYWSGERVAMHWFGVVCSAIGTLCWLAEIILIAARIAKKRRT